MIHQCLLDLFPVELLHILLTYFWAHEIFFTFYNVTEYIDAILQSYSSYQLNLISIKKFDFDILCDYIRPNQILSLILSDDNDTPGLSELFLSKFPIEDFIQLQSLTLIQIDIDSLKLILRNLYKLNQLKSFSFNIETIRHKYPAWNHDYLNEFQRFKFLLIQTYHQILPQLYSISFQNSNDLISISLTNLRQLKLLNFTSDELEKIFQNSLDLKSLNITTHLNTLDSIFFFSEYQIIRLNLTIRNSHISSKKLKEFLSKLSYLKYFQLEIPFRRDLADGYLWKKLTNSLLTFNFKFYAIPYNISLSHIDNILNSFRTLFWIKKKRWFVGYLNDCLFSIPYFSPVYTDSRQLSYYRSTISDHSIIFNHINTFIINTNTIQTNHYLTNIKTLLLGYPISLTILQTVIDLKQIKHLIVSSLDDLIILLPLYNQMCQLNKLTIKNNLTIDMIERIKYLQFKQIHRLEIRINDRYRDYIIEELFYLFPSIEYLIYKSTVDSLKIMIRLIKGFNYLSKASFQAYSSFVRKEEKFCRNPQLIIEKLLQNVTCQVYHSINTQIPISIHWQIQKQSTNDWSREPKYYWYRLNYILLRFSYKHLLIIQYFLQFSIYLPLIILILKPYYKNFDIYFIIFCLINTICLTFFYNIFYQESGLIQNDNTLLVFLWKINIWIICSFIVFLFSFSIQILYNYIFS